MAKNENETESKCLAGSGSRLCQVRIENLRCLQQVEVNPSELNILISQKNSGETSSLDALCAAIGTGPHYLCTAIYSLVDLIQKKILSRPLANWTRNSFSMRINILKH